MAYDFTALKKRLAEGEEHYKEGLSTLRTGRATPALLDSVVAESYGSRTPIKHLASITIEDPRSLRVTPWDKSQIKPIESAIAAANLGVSTQTDGASLRVIFPELTTDRRKALMKLAKEKLEEARIAVRLGRDEVWNDIQGKEKEGGMSEDEKFRFKDELQKYIDAANAKLEEILAKKEEEISE